LCAHGHRLQAPAFLTQVRGIVLLNDGQAGEGRGIAQTATVRQI
jgi:hypothetical protein